MLDKTEKFINTFNNILGNIAAFLTLVMLFNVFMDAILRYFFHFGWISLQEMEWHLFSAVFLLGIGYTLQEDSHVRVDVLYTKLTPRTQAIINIVGTFVLLIPLSVLIINGSTFFVQESYKIQEVSPDPGGLSYRFLIKGLIPLSFSFLCISALGFALKNLKTIKKHHQKH